ncbi:hypothetical protein AGR4B_Lc20111 [Agrobacterium tumefaciens str. CFBP 5621]|nr:hypothetical protein AGR4B_Lc20111 [Agrobacterium tumefaciens str. CFBP 5621]
MTDTIGLQSRTNLVDPNYIIICSFVSHPDAAANFQRLIHERYRSHTGRIGATCHNACMVFIQI